jgi:Regulator of chromosome condensation (RCC1) repeat
VNRTGDLGGNILANASLTPGPVYGLGSGVTALAIGVAPGLAGNHVCAVVHGRVVCWGYNGDGALGNGTQSNSFWPVPVAGL